MKNRCEDCGATCREGLRVCERCEYQAEVRRLRADPKRYLPPPEPETMKRHDLTPIEHLVWMLTLLAMTAGFFLAVCGAMIEAPTLTLAGAVMMAAGCLGVLLMVLWSDA